MKRALTATAKVLAWTLAIVVAVLLLVLAEPRWLLNTKTAHWAVKKFGADYRPKWSKLSLNVTNANLLTKRVVFDARDLCFHEKRGELDACFPILTLDATIHFGFSPLVSVRRLEKLIVHSTDVALDETKAPPAKPKKKAKKGGNYHLIPPPVRHMTVGLIDVKIPKAVVVTSSGTTTAAFAASFTEEGSAPLVADAQVVVSTGPKAAVHYDADLRLDSDLLRLGRATYLDLLAHVRGDAVRAKIAAKLSQTKDQEVRLAVDADALMAGRTLQARLAAAKAGDKETADGSVAVIDPKGPAQRVELKDCRFEAPLKKERPTRQDLTCALVLEPTPLGGLPKTGPKQLTGTLAYHADFKGKSRFRATLKADIGPDPRLYGFYAHLAAALAGRTDEIPQSLTAEHKLEVGFKVERFKDLVEFLSKTDFAVPAPVNAFHGPLSFTARTAGNSRGRDQRLDYEAMTDLSSQKQRLKSRVTGHLDVTDMFSPGRAMKDVTEVTLQDVALQLPYLKLGPMPSPLVDKRIITGNPRRDQAAEQLRPKTEEQQAKTASALAYDAHVVTRQPVKIISNLLKSPVPISLDLHAKTAGLSGQIRIEPFDMEIFHQTGRVDHITLTPSPASSDMGLDGKIVYKRQDVTIDILLLGSTSKPTITFESNPPMTQNEIVAMLLYGKSPAQLDTDQQASAGTASQAFTSGAFGLASLYLFASTPVQSVGYDPATQTYDIKFKLPGGATLGVGSNLEESKTLSLQKRLGHNLEVETQLQQNQQQQGPQGRNAITTFLEWFRRY